MRHITDEATLRRYIERDMRKVLDAVGKDILEIIQDNMDKWIYDYHKPNKIYTEYNSHNPTGEFYRSWKEFTRKSRANGLSVTIQSDKNRMSSIAEYGVHNETGMDMRSKMSSIINEGLDGDDWYNSPRPFFDDTIRKLDSNGYIWAMIKQKMKQQGLNVV